MTREMPSRAYKSHNFVRVAAKKADTKLQAASQFANSRADGWSSSFALFQGVADYSLHFELGRLNFLVSSH